MTPDRNDSDDANRCKSCGVSQSHSAGDAGTLSAASPTARANAHLSQEELIRLRERALLKREESIGKREDELDRRAKTLAMQQEKSFALRVQEISDAQIAKATQDYRYSKLKEANDSLVSDSQMRSAELEERTHDKGPFRKS